MVKLSAMIRNMFNVDLSQHNNDLKIFLNYLIEGGDQAI
jgi:hypothetical protein